MPVQFKLYLYGRGIYKTKSGHLRYYSKQHRHQYVHRLVAENLIEETPYSVKLLLPWPYEVHHMDYNKENNRPENLLLIDERLHSCMTAHRERGRNGQFGSKFHPLWKPAPLYLEQELFHPGSQDIPF